MTDVTADAVTQICCQSEKAVDRNGGRVFRKDFSVKGAKRRLRRSETLDRKILSKLLLAVAIDGAMRPIFVVGPKTSMAGTSPAMKRQRDEKGER